MTKPENLSGHIRGISDKDWGLLFGLLPAIKTAKKFGTLVGSQKMPDGSVSLPVWLESEIVSGFFNACYFLGIVVVFDWSAWQEGIQILNDPETDFNAYDLTTLCKLITAILRGDKFCEGYMINCFETGLVQKILEAMQQKVVQTGG